MVKLAKNRNQWKPDERKPVEGPALRPSVSPAIRYNAGLRKLIEQMHADTVREYRALFSTGTMDAVDNTKTQLRGYAAIIHKRLTERFDSIFELSGKPLAAEMLTATNANSVATLGASLREISEGVTFKADFTGEGVDAVLRTAMDTNVGLIKSIPAEYLSKVSDAAYDSIATGKGMADLFPAINERFTEQKRRAQLIAEDQNRKAYTALNSARMEKVGQDDFEWVHTGGSRDPREYHANILNGNRYKISDPPVIDEKTGERGLPGQLPNCRCIMRPIISFE